MSTAAKYYDPTRAILDDETARALAYILETCSEWQECTPMVSLPGGYIVRAYHIVNGQRIGREFRTAADIAAAIAAGPE